VGKEESDAAGLGAQHAVRPQRLFASRYPAWHHRANLQYSLWAASAYRNGGRNLGGNNRRSRLDRSATSCWRRRRGMLTPSAVFALCGMAAHA